MEPSAEYDPRYLAGIMFFNRRDFFDAHEVWEDLWRSCATELRRFYQGLIQAAVALHHWNNGNSRGAKRLFHSGRKYMSTYHEHYLGMNIARFWQGMERALADVLGESPPPAPARLDAGVTPTIELQPPPLHWPDPRQIMADTPDGSVPDE
jgi:predicted metal-dependent hydrolase